MKSFFAGPVGQEHVGKDSLRKKHVCRRSMSISSVRHLVRLKNVCFWPLTQMRWVAGDVRKIKLMFFALTQMR